VAQSAEETGSWTSPIWRERLNPAGIGVTDAVDHVYKWASGEDAARAQIVHLSAYALKDEDRRWEIVRPYEGLDPRLDAVFNAGWGGVAKTINDLTGKWATDPFYAAKIATLGTLIFPGISGGSPPVALNMTKGLIPLPPIRRHLVDVTKRPASNRQGYSYLGQRAVRGVVLHRMQGTLGGTDNYFHQPSCPALTDFGIDNLTGDMIQWADPTGAVSGWASGPVDEPYGDGKAFVDKYGVTAVNRDQVSLEFGGWFLQPGAPSREEPVNPVAFERAALFIAHYAHDYGISWDVFPIAPQDGFSFVRWHQEFTIGTGKVCPGGTVMDATDEMIARTQAIMRQFQTGTVLPVPPPPTPPPADPFPYAALFGEADGFAYDENGPVSKAWREAGASTNRYPPLVRVVTHNGKRLFQFSDGTNRS
jgi:hypothetical protein